MTPVDIPDDSSDSVANTPAYSPAAWVRAAPGNRRDGLYATRLDSEALRTIEIQPHWSVPWADLMMVMMVMFAVMFVALRAERNVGELFRKEVKTLPPAAKAPPQLDLSKGPVKERRHVQISAQEILRLSEKLIAEANLDEVDVVLTENQAVKVSVRGNLLFDSGKADLKLEAISFLDKLAQIIATNNYQIEIIGHTDNFPISNPAYPTNWELSTARSARVARYLIQTGNLEPGRFTIIGHAFYRPTVPNATPENKARNRRVEIVITRNEYSP